MSEDHRSAPLTVIEHHADRAMSPVVAMGMEMLRNNPDPSTLRELLAVQKDYEANEARKAYSLAISSLKRDLPTVIARDKLVSFGNTKYTHTSLAAVMDAITDPLTIHGFSLAWKPSTTASEVTVTCRLTHSAGHFEEATISAPPDTAGSKSKPQAVASTITLLQRYTALSLLGIATADMEEPKGEPKTTDPDHVDSARNLKAVGWLVRQGRTRIAAEEFLARSVEDWTAGDLEKLRTWAIDPNAQSAGQ